MNTESDIAAQLLHVAANATRRTSEETFSTLLSSTRQSFRRRSVANINAETRGRKRKRTFKKAVILLKLAHADFCPSKTELQFLKEKGLGEAKNHLEIDRNSNIQLIKEDIIELYDPSIQRLLRMCGFKLAKADKSKRITTLENLNCGTDIEIVFKQGKIIVLPLHDFPNDLPSLHVEPSTSAIMLSANSSRRVNSERAEGNNRRDNALSGYSNTTLNSSSSLYIDDLEEEESDSNDNINEITHTVEREMLFPSINELSETETIYISRSNCLNDILNIYQNQEILTKLINVVFLDEIGVDGGGLTKEMFNIFFSTCAGIYFHGEDCLVPHLDLNRLNDLNKFVIIGRVLQHMITLTNSVPTKLSKVTLMLISDPQKEIDPEVLITELGNYVNPFLRKIMKKAVRHFESLIDFEKETLEDFYQSCRFFAKVSSTELVEQLKIIATEILIEKPRRLILKMREGVSPEVHNRFWQNCDFEVLIEMQKPTPTKVINCLTLENELLTEDEGNVLHFFKMFIHCLDNEKLGTLLFLITGSFTMPLKINVTFNDTMGLSQRPIFTTCTDTVSLPKSYSSYDQLKSDFYHCIMSEEAKEYNSY